MTLPDTMIDIITDTDVNPFMTIIAIGILIGNKLLYDVPIQNRINGCKGKELFVNLIYNISNYILFISRHIMSMLLLLYEFCYIYYFTDNKTRITPYAFISFIITTCVYILYIINGRQIDRYYRDNNIISYRIPHVLFTLFLTLFIVFTIIGFIDILT